MSCQLTFLYLSLVCFYCFQVRSVRELTLDVGEDRVVLEARKVGYLLDIFLPFNVDNNSCSAQFHRDEQVLTVHMLINK